MTKKIESKASDSMLAIEKAIAAATPQGLTQVCLLLAGKTPQRRIVSDSDGLFHAFYSGVGNKFSLERGKVALDKVVELLPLNTPLSSTYVSMTRDKSVSGAACESIKSLYERLAIIEKAKPHLEALEAIAKELAAHDAKYLYSTFAPVKKAAASRAAASVSFEAFELPLEAKKTATKKTAEKVAPVK